MSHLTLNENQLLQIDALNQCFEGARPAFVKSLSLDNLINDIHALDTIESYIPESLRIDLHFDLIMEGKVTDYYKSISGGTNYILEAARKAFPNSKQITESIESFKEYLITLINETDLSAVLPPGTPAPLAPRKQGGFWDVLKSLFKAVTEGGSPIGILHFIIDIVGLVGDFIIPGVGVIADLINAVIYYFRGETLLAAVSLIAAVVIGAGDMLKLGKSALKPARPVFDALFKTGGADDAAKVLSKMSAKEQSSVVRILTQVSGNIGGALGKATSLFGKFFEGFGKVTKWVPGLGPALNPTFKWIGKLLGQLGEKMSLFSANLKLMKAGAKEAANLSIDAALKAGGDFVVDGPWIKVLNKEGKQIAKYPAKEIDKVTSKQLIDLTAKKAGSEEAAKILYRNPEDLIRVSNTLTSDSVNKTFFEKTAKFLIKRAIKGSARFQKDLIFFIGKQIYKIIFGSDWVEGISKWTKPELMGHGNVAMNKFINDRITEERKKSGAVYLPYVELDSSDQEVVDQVTDYQNHFAKLHGLPSVMNVVYDKYGNEKISDEFDEFFDEVGKSSIESPSGNTQANLGNEMGDLQRSSNSQPFESRTVYNFSDFKK